MRSSVVLVVVTLLTAGFLHAQESTPVTRITGEAELVKKKGAFLETWVHPDADLGRYDKLFLWRPEFQFRDVGEPRSTGSTTRLLSSGGPFGIREEDRQRFEQVVTETFVKELERSKLFKVVDRVGPGTLIVRAEVLDIVSNVPPSYTGTSHVYLSDVGEATLLFELIDASTGVIQARAGERRRIQPPGRLYEVSTVPATSATVWSEVQRWAAQAGRDLRRALEKSRKKAQ